MTITPNQARRALVALYAANAISETGNVMSYIAIPWFVLQTTGSAGQTGLTAFFSALPVVLAGMFGGVFVDRLGYRRASVLSDAISAVTVAALPLLYFTTGLAFWQVLVLVFLGALLDAPGGAARSSLLPDLAGAAGIRLERASALADGIVRGARMVGAPLAGLLIGVLGAGNLLWLDAASFVVSAALVAVAVPAVAAKTPVAAPGSYLADLRAGFRFLLADGVIVALGVTVMITNALDAAMGAVILPVYANRVFGRAVELGLLMAAFGAAALAGTLAFAAVGHRLPRRAALTGGFLVLGLRFWLLATFPGLAVLLAMQAVSGFSVGPINPLISTVSYERIPPAMRARAFGTLAAAVTLATPLGVLVGGYLVEWFGLAPALLALGGLYVSTALSLAINPGLRAIGGGGTRTGAARN